jgi:FtsP/CotA-like multicopper oxidase with cupredoxin domain
MRTISRCIILSTAVACLSCGRSPTALPDPPVVRSQRGAAVMHMTNLHFHGFTVSPLRPQDDVLDMIAMPGEALDYAVTIPRDHLPGLYWYHTHPHGESHQQVLDGMSGALIVDGIEQYAPAVRNMRERVIVIRAADVEQDPNASAKESRVELERTPCGESHDEPSRIFTVNGIVRPEIDMQPAERQCRGLFISEIHLGHTNGRRLPVPM